MAKCRGATCSTDNNKNHWECTSTRQECENIVRSRMQKAAFFRRPAGGGTADTAGRRRRGGARAAAPACQRAVLAAIFAVRRLACFRRPAGCGNYAVSEWRVVSEYRAGHAAGHAAAVPGRAAHSGGASPPAARPDQSLVVNCNRTIYSDSKISKLGKKIFLQYF